MAKVKQLEGKEALDAFNAAMAHVKAGRYEEAVKVHMRSSDRSVIEMYIQRAKAKDPSLFR